MKPTTTILATLGAIAAFSVLSVNDAQAGNAALERRLTNCLIGKGVDPLLAEVVAKPHIRDNGEAFVSLDLQREGC